ncbi:MAG: DUF1592 domain-containing protein [Acidobacteria bacterium]|nr:DUF1592 domain-containing protein [Acidobacteriota bacterium]
MPSPPRRTSLPAVLLSVLAVGAAAGGTGASAAGTPPAATVQAPGTDAGWQRALLDRYCVGCHNDRLRTADLALDRHDVTRVADAPAVWETVVRKLRAGAMPPPDRPRPDAATYGRFVRWLEDELDSAAAANPNPGRTEAFHRLNRTEYHHAVRDLLDLEVDVAELLPADGASYGFDNIAGVLGVSPTLVERYLAAARRISRIAVGRPAPSATAEVHRLPSDLAQDDWVAGMPFGTRGGGRFRHVFPQDADYDFRIRLARDAGDALGVFAVPHTLEVSLDGTLVRTFTVGEPPPPGAPRDSADHRAWRDRQRSADRDWAFRLPVGAGPRDVRVTFVRRTAAYPETLRQPYRRPYTSITGGDTRVQPYLGSVTITGPYAAIGGPPATETPSRRRIFVCRPADVAPARQPSPADSASRPTRLPGVPVVLRPGLLAEQEACARRILTGLARRAYRRPVTAADLDVLLGFYDEGRRDGGFDAGVEMALRWLLASPEFVLRVERDPAGAAPGGIYPVSDLELASRLSFFLWSSIPDDELLDAAVAGRLRDPDELERQARRMLADDRSRALVTSFASQWLHLRNLPAVVPDEDRFPHVGEALRQAMQRETELFVESVLRGDGSVLDLLTADYTFVNERLARHYDLPGVYGSHFRRVRQAHEARRGLLGHASILSVTSYPNRTSPVLRGKWILENLLGTPPALPPPDVPALEETTPGGEALSMREATERHRANPVCASCHRLMDPPGFALEQFDAVGRFRTRTAAGTPIDATGELPDGTRFDGAAGLREALVRTPDRFVGTLAEKLLTYALGRGLEPYDAPAVRAIVRDAAADGYRFSSLVAGIVRSAPFRLRKAES